MEREEFSDLVISAMIDDMPEENYNKIMAEFDRLEAEFDRIIAELESFKESWSQAHPHERL